MPRETASICAARMPRSPVGRGRALPSAVLIALFALTLWAPGAGAAPVRAKGFRVASVCRPPAPGRATCLAERLVPETLTSSRASANRALYKRAAARHQRIPALRKTPYPGFLTPERLHAAYGLPTETPAGPSQTIAVVDAYNDPTAEEDLAVYDKQFGLGECTTANGCFKKINQHGKSSPLPETEGGWAGEISIDVQMARAICQNCHILLVETDSEEFSDLGAGVNAAVAAGATVISNSYGGPEFGSYTGLASAYYNHPGVVVTASSGDCGYLNKACKGTQKANFPASFQDVVSIGGTSLTESGGVWTSTVWNEGGSGCSTVFSAALWQTTVANYSATGCGSGRAVADVSAIGDPNTGVDVYDSTPEGLGSATGWGVWGGTSVASPIIAAEWALAGGAHGVEYPASTLYTHSGLASDFYDVTSGTNGSCGSTTICKAAIGFDGPTGVGSPVGLGAFAIGNTPTNSSPPTVTGTAVQDETLTAGTGEWTGAPTGFAYQWERCGGSCSTISGATGATYALVAADVGSHVRVRVTASNENGSGPAAYSAQTATVLSDAASVTGFTPSGGITGATITIKGTGFSSTSQVLLRKFSAAFTIVSPTELQVVVPNGAVSGKLAVTTAHGKAKSKAKYTVTFSIKSFKPAAGAAGTSVTIKGVGFNGSSAVKFNGVVATVTSVTATKLKATVPAGAGTGPITVTNTAAPAGTVSSAGNFAP